jgi:hypothetical protein
MRSGEVGINQSGALNACLPLVAWSQACWLSCTTPPRWTDNFTYTAFISEHGQKGIVEAICRPPNARLLMCHLACPMEVPPAQVPPHVLHAWNAHECSKKVVRTARKLMFRYMSPSVSCDSRVCWTSAYRKVRHSTVHVSSRTAQRFTILHSPARPHPASTSFSFSLSLQPQPCTSARLSAR